MWWQNISLTKSYTLISLVCNRAFKRWCTCWYFCRINYYFFYIMLMTSWVNYFLDSCLSFWASLLISKGYSFISNFNFSKTIIIWLKLILFCSILFVFTYFFTWLSFYFMSLLLSLCLNFDYNNSCKCVREIHQEQLKNKNIDKKT